MKKKNNKRTKLLKPKGISIPIDEDGRPYGWGLLFGCAAAMLGIPVSTYRPPRIRKI